MKKILIATGGTGGHTFVALAIAEKLIQHNIKVIFTTSHPLSFNHYPFYRIHTRGFVGIKFPLINWCFLLLSIFESFLILLKERPNAVIGTGSYASLAPALVSRLFFIPLFITEIDSIPGMATRFLSIFADSIYLSFKSAENTLPKRKTRVFGCPIRDLRVMEKTEAKRELGLNPDLFLILVFGGSGGALSINNLIVELIPELNNIQFLLSTGRRDYEIIEKKIERNGTRVYPFIKDMGLAYSASDIVISRAGALTLAELQRFRKPAILIPYPYAAKRHQRRNAELLKKRGCVTLIENPSVQRLKEEIYRLKDSKIREAMADSFPETGNAAEKIADDIMKKISTNKTGRVACSTQ